MSARRVEDHVEDARDGAEQETDVCPLHEPSCGVLSHLARIAAVEIVVQTPQIASASA